MAFTKVTNGVSEVTHTTTVSYVSARCIIDSTGVVDSTATNRTVCENITDRTWTGALSVTAGGSSSVLINITDLLADLQLGDIGG